ncbi:NAD-dependent epimerase/dehydratase family protein [Halobacteriovorax sp.]|uniref:NAD-dependent epimerase/dehydratase family protein n=1 Tax=Halobacteriovorax sp. TaxID=2020862 RepID=UPI003AF1F826
MDKKKIIITGGLGFLGSAIAKNFFHKYDVVIIDKIEQTDSKVNRLTEYFDHFFYRKMDLAEMSTSDIEWLEDELTSTHLFFHFAAAVGVKSIDKDPKASIIKEYQVNMALLPMLAKNKTRTIFASTSEVYGNKEDCKEDQELSIGTPDILRWGYACNKLMTEFLIRSYDVPHTIIRLFNVTGKNQSASQGMVLPKMIQDAKEKNRIYVYNQGKQTRAFCHVDDFVNSIDSIVHSDLFHNQIVNIGNDENKISILELAYKVKELISPNAEIELKDYHEEYSNESEDIFKRSPDTTKLKQVYTPSIGIDEIILSFKDE